MGTPSGADSDLRCSFCGKASDEVAKLVANVSFAAGEEPVEANTCNECVSLHVEVMATTIPGWLEAQIEKWRASDLGEKLEAGHEIEEP